MSEDEAARGAAGDPVEDVAADETSQQDETPQDQASTAGDGATGETSTGDTSADDVSIGDDAFAAEIAGLLRERMFQAVASIEPTAGTLEYLHQAVPARRKRRQTALATTAVTVLAVGTAVALAGQGVIGRTGSDTANNVGNMLSHTTTDVNGGGGTRGTGSGSGTHTPQYAYPPKASTPGVSQAPTTPVFITPPLGSASLPALVPNCQNSSMAVVTPTAGPVVNGVSYETVTATVKTACVIAGPPQLTVLDAAGAVSSRIPIFKADGVAAPGLAAVPTWGRQLVLKPGDKFQFQFAWVADACPVPVPPSTTGPTSGAAGTPTGGGSPTDTGVPTDPGTSTPPVSGSSGPQATPSQSAPKPAPTSFAVVYSVYGAQPIASATFSQSCGAAVYVTDLFQDGEYPAPHGGGVGVQNLNPSPSS